MQVINSLTIAVLASGGFTSLAAETTPRKPNILFIAVDDLRPELGCYGRDYIESPNIDRIVRRQAWYSVAPIASRRFARQRDPPDDRHAA